MTRVLVTGATGFLGRRVVQQLAGRGMEAHAVARTTPAEGGEVRWHATDLFDGRAVDELLGEVAPSHLLHLAWYAEHGAFWHAPENLDWVAASLRLVRSFRAAGGRRVVAAGTCAEYDWTGDCCAGGTALRPATLYGIAKNALREVLEGYAEAGGPATAWGRVFFLYGPGEQPTRVVPSVARALVAGQHVDTSPGEQIRDFLHVDDVASAFVALLESEETGTFDIGSGSGIRLREVFERLERLAGAEGLVRIDEALRRDEPERIVADATRLRGVGWEPAIALGEGLERTFAWWREQQAGGNRL